jgi:hypothetical protein
MGGGDPDEAWPRRGHRGRRRHRRGRWRWRALHNHVWRSDVVVALSPATADPRVVIALNLPAPAVPPLSGDLALPVAARPGVLPLPPVVIAVYPDEPSSRANPLHARWRGSRTPPASSGRGGWRPPSRRGRGRRTGLREQVSIRRGPGDGGSERDGRRRRRQGENQEQVCVQHLCPFSAVFL